MIFDDLLSPASPQLHLHLIVQTKVGLWFYDHFDFKVNYAVVTFTVTILLQCNQTNILKNIQLRATAGMVGIQTLSG